MVVEAVEATELAGGGGGGCAASVWSDGWIGGGGGTPMNPAHGYKVAATAGGGGGIGAIPGGGGTGIGPAPTTVGGIAHGAAEKKKRQIYTLRLASINFTYRIFRLSTANMDCSTKKLHNSC